MTKDVKRQHLYTMDDFNIAVGRVRSVDISKVKEGNITCVYVELWESLSCIVLTYLPKGKQFRLRSKDHEYKSRLENAQ